MTLPETRAGAPTADPRFTTARAAANDVLRVTTSLLAENEVLRKQCENHLQTIAKQRTQLDAAPPAATKPCPTASCDDTVTALKTRAESAERAVFNLKNRNRRLGQLINSGQTGLKHKYTALLDAYAALQQQLTAKGDVLSEVARAHALLDDLGVPRDDPAFATGPAKTYSLFGRIRHLAKTIGRYQPMASPVATAPSRSEQEARLEQLYARATEWYGKNGYVVMAPGTCTLFGITDTYTVIEAAYMNLVMNNKMLDESARRTRGDRRG